VCFQCTEEQVERERDSWGGGTARNPVRNVIPLEKREERRERERGEGAL
jgi:hypothetical protein